MTTLLITHPACLEHEMGEGHPERPDRLRSIERAFEAEAFQMLARDVAPCADVALIARVHPSEYIEALRAITPTQGHTAIDEDTSMSPGSFEAALRSAGGAVFGVDEVMTGKATNAFVATRPPGHHAETTMPMGFCFFNNAAIGRAMRRRFTTPSALQSSTSTRITATARSISSGTNGTFCTLRPTRCRSSPGPATLLNVASTIRSSTRRCAQATLEKSSERRWRWPSFRKLADFGPDLVIISAGFDAHRRDPLANPEGEGTAGRRPEALLWPHRVGAGRRLSPPKPRTLRGRACESADGRLRGRQENRADRRSRTRRADGRRALFPRRRAVNATSCNQ